MSDKKTKPLLTDKQELFSIEYVLNGGNAAEAYRKTYDSETESDSSLYVQAHKVLHNSKVSLRVHELQMQEYSSHILSIDERKQLLTKWAKKGDGKSIDMLNKMEGVYTEKLEVKSTQEVHYYAPKKDKTK